MHYKVHRWLAVHVIKDIYGFSQLEFGRFPQKTACQSLVVMEMGDCKAELSVQSLQDSLSHTFLSVSCMSAL